MDTMNENERKTGKLSRFFEEKGFYIILFLCVIAIGISGYVLFGQPQEAAGPGSADEISAVSQPSGASDAPQALLPGRSGHGAVAPELTDPTPKASASDEGASIETLQPSAGAKTADQPADKTEMPKQEPPRAQDKPAAQTPQTSAASEQNAAPKAAGETADKVPDYFVKPVEGEVIRQFCISELVYDRTMGDWRTHNGADLAASAGEKVLAIADGTVQSVTHSELYGTVVVIAHGGGLESSCFGLSEEAAVAAGERVQAGDVIGTVAPDAHFEALEPAHLHLELKQDGKYVDPAEWMPQD